MTIAPSHPLGHAMKVKSIKRSYTFLQTDIDTLEEVKDRALNRKVVLTDSQVIRMGLAALSSLSETELEKLAEQSPKLVRRLGT